MSIIGYNLSQYPLDEHYKACQQYMYSSMDWSKISDAIQANGTTAVDVSDTISLFSHLELDPEYRLICYMTLEYHGIWGKVAAVRTNEDWRPRIDINISRQKIHLNSFNNNLHMPECVFPPTEAIFNDGSAEGYFEAVLCALFLQALPYGRFQQDKRLVIMNSPPNDYEEKWGYQVALADWNPRYTEHAITALLRKYENGIGSSDGKDHIYLTKFSFYRSVNESVLFSALKTQSPASPNHITSNKRYDEKRKCCVFSQSSVLVAEEMLPF